MKTTSIRIRITDEQLESLRKITDLTGATESKMVQMALERWLKEEGLIYSAAMDLVREKLRERQAQSQKA
jgi:predicted DNA-binding protein